MRINNVCNIAIMFTFILCLIAVSIIGLRPAMPFFIHLAGMLCMSYLRWKAIYITSDESTFVLSKNTSQSLTATLRNTF